VTELLEPHAMGEALARRDGERKVRGTATYAYETPVEHPVYAHVVQAAVARGMFGPEVALHELAGQLGIDPVELRVRNEPAADPETGKPWSSRHLVECLRDGARRLGWHDRDPRPGVRREGQRLTGSGVASSVYPTMRMPQSPVR
jgi:CO/xanthine dehydrogenase Mo-binding subunit